MTRNEAIITLVTSLPEIELAEVMTEVIRHIQREKLDHLINDVFEIDTNEDEIEDLHDEIRELENQIDRQENEISELKEKLKKES